MEYWDLFDADGKPVGKMQKGDKQPLGTFRRVVHACIFADDGTLLCQRRQPFKDDWCGMWDVSVGGSVVSGETFEQGVRRETFEELGLSLPENIVPSLTLWFDGGWDSYFCVTQNVDLSRCRLQADEVAEVAWLTLEDILQKLQGGDFIPYQKGLLETLFFLRNRKSSHTVGWKEFSRQKNSENGVT